MKLKEPCILCGHWFMPDIVEAVAYINNTRWGSVCESCLTIGEAEKKEMLKAHTHKVREQARYTLDWADELECASLNGITSPTLQEFEQFRQEAEKNGAGILDMPIEEDLAIGV